MKAIAAGFQLNVEQHPYQKVEGDLEIRSWLHDETEDILLTIGSPTSWVDVEVDYMNAVYLVSALNRHIDSIQLRRDEKKEAKKP